MKQSKKLSVAIGRFDGLHTGHIKVIESAMSKKGDMDCAVITFDYDCKDKLISDDQKRQKIYVLGVDEIISFKMNEIKDFSPWQFVREILKDRLNVGHISVGFNFKFGKNASGDVALLESMCRKIGISVTVITPVKLAGNVVSSTKIKQMLADGNVSGASNMLGYNFAYTSKIVRGDGRGKNKLGTATINQEISNDIFVVKHGVYRSKTVTDGGVYDSISNVGTRPTVSGKTVNCETHIYDFDRDLYGETVTVELLEFIRNEKKFETLSELKTQIEADIATVKRKNSLHLK